MGPGCVLSLLMIVPGRYLVPIFTPIPIETYYRFL